jgi:hypothetical protein
VGIDGVVSYSDIKDMILCHSFVNCEKLRANRPQTRNGGEGLRTEGVVLSELEREEMDSSQ